MLLVFLIIFAWKTSASEDKYELSYSLIEIPEFSGAKTPRLHAKFGNLILSWVKEKNDIMQLQYIQLSDDRWSPIVTVAEGDGWLLNPHDYAQVVPISEKTYMAIWMEFTSFRDFAYRFNTRVSTDGGKSWVNTLWPKELETFGQHGFAVAASNGGDISMYWVSTYQDNGRLLTANLSPEGIWSTPMEKDEKICSCCHLAMTDAMLLSYRDRSDSEIRDIAVISGDQKSRQSHIPRPDNWKISGCPVNAPSLVQRNNMLALAWYSEGEDETDIGNRLAVRELTDPIQWNSIILKLKTLGHTDLAWLSNETLVMSSVSVIEGISHIDLQIFTTTNGVAKFRKHFAIPVDSIIGAPSLVAFQNSLYLAFYSPTESKTKLFKSDIRIM